MSISNPSVASLLAAFRAARPDTLIPQETERSLGDRLLALWRESRLRHPGLSLAAEPFARAVAITVDLPAIESSFERLDASDLFLACAAGLGDAAAIGLIEREMLPNVKAALLRARYSPLEAEEVAAVLLAHLLVSDGGAPLIRQYRGRGPLLHWIRVCALRLARRMFGQAREIPVAADLIAEIGPLGGDPELEYLKRRYCREFQEAWQETMAARPRRDRALLRLHLVEGLTIDQMAAIYHLHRATVARRIARAQADLLDAVRERLLARLKITGKELDSVLRLIESRIEIAALGLS